MLRLTYGKSCTEQRGLYPKLWFHSLTDLGAVGG